MDKNMAVGNPPLPWRLTNPAEPGFLFNPPETPFEPMEFLSRSWSFSALQVSKALAPPSKSAMSRPVSDAKVEAQTILEDVAGESAVDDPKEPVVPSSSASGYPFSFTSWEASTQYIVDRIMSQSQEVSPRTSARSSHSSGPLVGSSLPDISPFPPSEIDDIKYFHLNNNTSATTAGRRMMKERKEKRKEDQTRPQNAQLHAAVSVAGVAAAVAAIAAASSSSRSTKDRELDWTDMAVASAATLVAAQCVEAAESVGAEREHLASVVSSAVNVRSADNIMTLTAAAARALRGAASVKARALKEISSVATVLPIDKGMVNGGNSSIGSHSDELVLQQNFLGVCSKKVLARGCELLKRTRKGELHSKIVSIYINRMNLVTLKMKSRHVAGTLTKKKKYVVLEVVKGMPAWAGRYLLEGGENRRYFGLKTADRGLIEFECRTQREYEAWTEGVSRLLNLAAERNNMCRM